MRQSGQTTRIIDRAIQDLFKGKTVQVIDHYKHGQDGQANRLLYEKILGRLHMEHSGVTLDIDYKQGHYAIKLDKQSVVERLVDFGADSGDTQPGNHLKEMFKK